MAITTQQKRPYFQNSKILLENNSWENCIRSYSNVNYVPNSINNFFEFYSNNKLFFQTNNWLNGSYILYKNIELGDSFDLLYNSSKKCYDYNKFHLIRNKDKCSIVIGNELFANFNVTNIEKRLTNSFAGQFAKSLDTDLYSCHIANIDNTTNSLLIGKILKYIEKYNYKEIYLIFQLSDPSRCFKSLWWHPVDVFCQQNNPVVKHHLSYHFFLYEEMINYYKEENNIDFFKDSLFFSLGEKSKNGSVAITPNEFYKIYEWSIIDMINTQIDMSTSINVNTIFWRDFYKVCNNDLNVIQKSFLNFVTDKESLLPFDSENGFFVRQLIDNHPKRLTKKMKKLYGKIPDIPKYVYSVICEPGNLTEMFFLDNTSTQYSNFDSDWPKNYQHYPDTSKWANFILENAGWLK